MKKILSLLFVPVFMILLYHSTLKNQGWEVVPFEKAPSVFGCAMGPHFSYTYIYHDQSMNRLTGYGSAYLIVNPEDFVKWKERPNLR